MSKRNTLERSHKKALASTLLASIEVPSPVGFVDLMTFDLVIEIKKYRGWKSGMGQVLAYQRNFFRDPACLFPKYPVLALFDAPDELSDNLLQSLASASVSLWILRNPGEVIRTPLCFYDTHQGP